MRSEDTVARFGSDEFVQVSKGADDNDVAAIANRSSAAAIVERVVRLGHALGLVVVAEGVETAAQLSALRDLGCDLAQGYHLASPAPAPSVLPILGHPAVHIQALEDSDLRLD